jgi:hypothetical protein
MNKKKAFWAVATVLSALSYAIIAKEELKEKNSTIIEKNAEIARLNAANSNLLYENDVLKRI